MLRRIRIGPLDYTIRLESNPKGKEGQNVDGEINNLEGVIRIRSELHDTMKLQTLWHEIVHGICFHNRIKLNERDTDLLATALVTVLRDNKRL